MSVLLSLAPWWGRWAALVVLCAALVGFGYVHGLKHEKARWEAADAARATATEQAITARVASNTKLAVQQAATNAAITKVKNEELAPVLAHINGTPGVLIGAAICGGPAAPAEAKSAGSGDSADPPRRLVRDDIERDIRALKIAVEEDLATGRACQTFLNENGLVP